MSQQNKSGEAADGVPLRIGVLGGGRMGGGIAHAFLLAGASVAVVERDVAPARACRERITKSINVSIARGFDGSSDKLEQALHVGTDVGAFGDCRLVVEAVPEALDLKLEALSAIERHVPEDAVIASNTSSIPLAQLAKSLDLPGRFIGLHFFNPVPASRLIEVVVHEGVDAELPQTVRGWVCALGKTPITVSDSPGLASSRLGVALALEAIRMVEQGVASAEDIDLAMELGYSHSTGPLKTTDIVGLDVRLSIADQLQRDLGVSFAPPQLLRDMVSAGKLGRKSGQGFYVWN